MIKVSILIIAVITAILIGCHSNSDFVVGHYRVRTTVEASTCPDDLSTTVDGMSLPSGITVGLTTTSSWILERIGITGTGADHVSLKIYSPDSSENFFNITGTLEHGLVRIDLQQDISTPPYQLYRTILLRGSIEGDTFTGEIRTLLSNIDNSPTTFPFIPASSPCEVHEEFLGTK